MTGSDLPNGGEGGDNLASPPFASLPMYDWPEIREPTDALWNAVRFQLEKRGIKAPAALERDLDIESQWTAPGLVLSQTCGFPYANFLASRVTLIGTPSYALTGATAGHYHSVLIARKSEAPASLAELRDRRMAFNMSHSQSGFAAPIRLLSANKVVCEATPVETGAHRASVQAVANGQADWAAVDAVAWELARRHEPAARALEAFGRTPQTPGLPLIASGGMAGRAEAVTDAVDAAIRTLDPAVAKALNLTGFVRSEPKDYAPLAATLPIAETLPALATR
ncbi:phosphate/phosphite/phosphonate ABC transporter substrate-binding protein [Hoeflea sp.]|uniref:phosphate/phosphite/phosphonate ABC transporter substrate-binding protein n=1 Tax=Hoeflea sp. TaxID=1940281 RepID=UPI003BAE3F44